MLYHTLQQVLYSASQYMTHIFGGHRIAVLYDGDFFLKEKSNIDLIGSTITMLGGEVVFINQLPEHDDLDTEIRTDKNYSTILRNASHQHPDIFFVVSSADTGLDLLTQAYKMGIKTPFIGLKTWRYMYTKTPTAIPPASFIATGAQKTNNCDILPYVPLDKVCFSAGSLQETIILEQITLFNLRDVDLLVLSSFGLYHHPYQPQRCRLW